MRYSAPTILVLALTLPGFGAPHFEDGTLEAEDVFGDPIGPRSPLLLIDWEGYLANPAIEFDILVPKRAALPAELKLRADEPRLHFDLPSTTGPGGPQKSIEVTAEGKQGVVLSIFPDRDGQEEGYELEAELVDARGKRWSCTLPILVLDKDLERAPSFPITVDFSQDKTGFFDVKARRETVRQAAEDWTYFLDGAGLKEVPADAEQTFIWKKEGFTGGHTVRNAQAYVGFLLYAYGIHTPELRSGGEGSHSGGLQVQDEVRLPLRRSGGVEIEQIGNYNRLGWMDTLEDQEWWKATNLADVPNDLYSIAHHEIGHALIFNRAYPRTAEAREKGSLESPALTDYLGAPVKVDGFDHLHGTVDPITRRGAYGFEYHGEMPQGRWLTTPTDLRFAEAIGYRLLPMDATRPLAITTAELPAGKAGKPYSARLQAIGGIPIYRWSLEEGDSKLPSGLKLDPISGEISGRPRKVGVHTLGLVVRDGSRSGKRSERIVRLEVQRK